MEQSLITRLVYFKIPHTILVLPCPPGPDLLKGCTDLLSTLKNFKEFKILAFKVSFLTGSVD